MRMLRVRLFRNADDEEVRFVLHSRRAQSHTRQVARSRLHVPAMALASANVIVTISPLWCVEGFPRRVGCCVRDTNLSVTRHTHEPCGSDSAEHSGGWCAGGAPGIVAAEIAFSVPARSIRIQLICGALAVVLQPYCIGTVDQTESLGRLVCPDRWPTFWNG